MRLVATDLDGTLVRPDGTISDRTLAVLRACGAAGVDVLFVTGRPPRWMGPVAEATGLRGTAVCSNGAIVCDLGSGRVEQTYGLDPFTVHQVIRVLRGHLPSAAFALETDTGCRREPDFLPHPDDLGTVPPPVGPVRELLADRPVVLKVLCRVEDGQADPLLALARVALAGIAEPVHSSATFPLLEISAPGVSKASTLDTLVRARGLTAADVVAFGDMPNDVAMLRWAGHGYAMADGHPEAIAAADAVAPPCPEDGVAQVLERLLTGRR